jgi:hypothetical protein
MERIAATLQDLVRGGHPGRHSAEEITVFQSEYSASLPSGWPGLPESLRLEQSSCARERCPGDITPPVQGACSSSFISLLVGWVSI